MIGWFVRSVISRQASVWISDLGLWILRSSVGANSSNGIRDFWKHFELEVFRISDLNVTNICLYAFGVRSLWWKALSTDFETASVDALGVMCHL